MAKFTLSGPIADLVEQVTSGQVSATQLVQTALDRIAETEDYHAILELNRYALADAQAVDARVAAGEKLPLAGIPFAAKDNFLTLGTHTTAASHILETFTAPYEGPAIARLKAAGAVLVAKTNQDAFGHGGSTENSDFGPTKNAHDPSRVPGGSSGGSTTAVALGQVCFAIGTDTGGSIRQPSSLSGVVGLKVTYGLVPRTGVIAMASSTDTIGPMTNSVADAGMVLDVLAGRDASDATSIERNAGSYRIEADTLADDLDGVKIGLIKEYLGEGLDAEVKAKLLAFVDSLKSRGATVETVSIPATERALAAYYILVPAEISSNLARYDGIRYGHSAAAAANLEETYFMSRDQGFGAEAKRRIMIGTYVLSSGYYDAYYKRAQKVRTKLVEEFDDAFAKYDYLVGPAAPTAAFPLGSKSGDPLAMYLEDVMTVAVSLVGAPAVVVPFASVGDGLPVGLQIIGRQKLEGALLQVAAAVELAAAAGGQK
ncbi:Asp-tRNA(Asn)/Glu-tRNA(Gln) amidotransferase subunit GatA [Candidatus Saccharibacteria bacterium]|nr:Asp-tRNA(Asn)/Glu-tRNA(Gln) amidotransferase subunit GatA [Candidatus Saccharibacteria bacterium]